MTNNTLTRVHTSKRIRKAKLAWSALVDAVTFTPLVSYPRIRLGDHQALSAHRRQAMGETHRLLNRLTTVDIIIFSRRVERSQVG